MKTFVFRGALWLGFFLLGVAIVLFPIESRGRVHADQVLLFAGIACDENEDACSNRTPSWMVVGGIAGWMYWSIGTGCNQDNWNWPVCWNCFCNPDRAASPPVLCKCQ